MMNSSDGITEHLDPAVTARSDGETQVDPDPPTSRGHGKDGYSIPRYCSLEGITEITKVLQGLELETLARFDTIKVQTVNSQYRIFLLDPETGRALLEGGKVRDPIEVRVVGSSFGGAMLRTGCICVGLRMEACSNNTYIRTSPVQSLTLDHHTFPELVSSLSQ